MSALVNVMEPCCADGGSGGGVSTGSVVTGATANRIFISDADSKFQTCTSYRFEVLDYGTIMPSLEAVRGISGSGGFFSSASGGMLFGRVDSGPSLFTGYFSTWRTISQGLIGFSSNPNDLRQTDTYIERHDENIIKGAAFRKRAYTVAELNALDAAVWIDCDAICTNEAGGRTIVFCDGTNWRRVADRAVIS